MYHKLYIFRKEDNWMLSISKDTPPMMMFKTKSEAWETAIALKDGDSTAIYLEEMNEKGKLVLSKI